MYSKVIILTILYLQFIFVTSNEKICNNNLNGGSYKVTVDIAPQANSCPCKSCDNDLIAPPDASYSNGLDHLCLYRPGTGTFWILRNKNGTFTPMFREGDPGAGIARYDLKSLKDRAFSFDYDHSGRRDHIALYRPGTGTFWILKNSNGVFTPTYNQGDPGNGIGGYDLKSDADRAFSFDYDHTGKRDHIVLYRPGTGVLFIIRNNNGNFVPVFNGKPFGTGIGMYNLKSPDDRVLAFDYDHSGKADHLVLYRPGTGIIRILKNRNGSFLTVFASNSGINAYDLLSPMDRIFAFDYDSSGKLDHLVLYRPGKGTMWILKNEGGHFVAVYNEGDPGNGIGGYDLKSVNDRAFAFDYKQTGNLDHIVLYRPGTGTLWILQNREDSFVPVYAQGDPGTGIGGYDLRSLNDRVFALDW